MIYLDNAATTFFKPESVYQRSDELLRYFSANAGRSGHKPALEAAEIIYSARVKAAEFFNTTPENTVFTLGCTDSLNTVIKGILKYGNHVITTCYDHNSVIRPLNEMMRSRKVEVSVIYPDLFGEIGAEKIVSAIRKNTRMVIINHVSNVTGYVFELNEIIREMKKRGILTLLDCAQSAGTQEIPEADYICSACHKGLYGPQGLGILAIGRDAPLPSPIRTGGTGTRTFDAVQPQDMPEYLESGTQSVQSIGALMPALEFVEKNRRRILNHEIKLACRLMEGLNAVDGVKVYSPKDAKSGVVAFNIRNEDSQSVADILDKKYDICVRGGFHCAPNAHRYLKTEAQGALRASVSIFNEESEIDRAVEAIKEITKKLG